VRSNALVYSRSIAGMAGSNPAGDIDVCFLCLLCVLLVEAFASGQSLVQSSPTKCVCVIVSFAKPVNHDEIFVTQKSATGSEGSLESRRLCSLCALRHRTRKCKMYYRWCPFNTGYRHCTCRSFNNNQTQETLACNI
jgi:hypothetical protein